MARIDPPNSFESAWQTVEAATRHAAEAEMAAERAAVAAARQERLALTRPRSAELHARMARAHRASERCQRAAASMQRDFALQTAGWAARRDLDGLKRPVLMNAVARAAGWRDAVLSLRDHSGAEQLVAASGDTARRAHELEEVFGEGPSWDAAKGRSPRVAGAELEARWPLYGAAVARLDVHAVAAVPVVVGPRLRAGLTVTAPAPVRHVFPRLMDIGAAVRQFLLSDPEGWSIGGSDARGLGQFHDGDFQVELHQAAGALKERTGMPIADALALIRAHAYAEDRPVVAVAADVLRGAVLET